MKILSIDIGIKNLAICMIETNDSDTFKILQWDVINLCGEAPLCKCITTTKKQTKMCNKKATYEKNGICYCKTHAKKTNYIIPSNDTKINKLTLNELIDLASKYNITPITPPKKKDIIAPLKTYIAANSFNIIPRVKANELSLIDIGISISKKLTTQLDLTIIDKVIIENQLSPLASRMKTIQGMVAQYFIMHGIRDIIFISATNKLKPYITGKLNYKQRKEYGIKITQIILTSNAIHSTWKLVFEKHTKKDDLADSLLQGLSYAIQDKMITNNFIKTIKNIELSE